MNQRALVYAGTALGAALVTRSIVRRLRRYDLDGKVVVITGGSRGLGLVLARQLLSLRAKVAICARDIEELTRATANLAAHGGQLLALACDVTDPRQVAHLVARVRAELGPIDVLINNAGVIDVGPMEHMTTEDYERAMTTHFWAPLHMVLAVAPEMRRRGEGRIVNITSIGGKIAVPHLLPYTASKFALVGLSEGMRAELANDGVCVTTVVPGLMRTGSPPNAMFKGRHRGEYAWFAVSGSLAITSMSAERAAKRIIAALRHGDAEVVLSIQAKLAIKLHALAPVLTQRLMAVVNRLLPAPGGIGTRRAKGWDSASSAAPSRLTRASDRAAVRNNEV
jgi:NAD(P)-dependent dehydrogenase (short-subunit alcohol dehydrogenase family)